MAGGSWLLAGLLAVSPAIAAQTDFQGYAMETDGAADAPRLLRVLGKRYGIPGTPAQVVGRAQACLSRADSGAGVISVDPGGGRLVAIGRVPYRQQALGGVVRGRLTLEARDGGFGVVVSDLAIASDAAADPMDLVFLPLVQDRDAAWEPALAALIGVEEALVRCMFG